MSVLDFHDGLVIDLDGVVVHGVEPIRDAIAFLRRRRRDPRPIVYVTNNSTRTPAQWAELLTDLKVACEPEQVLTSAVAVSHLIASDPPPKVFVVGSVALQQQLLEDGLDIVTDADACDVVVVGFDAALTYPKLRSAARAIRRGARFIGTNPDNQFPTPDGVVPGNGATLAYLRAATGITPEIAGKPQTHLFELAGERLGDVGRLLVVGDQVGTDMAAAAKMGWDSALVMTGVASWTSLIDCPTPPTWILGHLGDLAGPTPPTIRGANVGEISAIRDILADAGYAEELDRVAPRLETTLVAAVREAPDASGVAAEGPPVGTIAWEIHGDGVLLRALAVIKEEQGHGLGSQLVVRALAEIAKTDLDWVYLLTGGADKLFENLGFWRVSRDRVPADMAEAMGEGASTALVRRLR